MRLLSSSLALAVAFAATGLSSSSSTPSYLGFNSGSLNVDNSAKTQQDFEKEFKLAQGLQGVPGTFNAVRLYTNIQAYSASDPISAFPAAIATKTYLLLGIWTSGTTSIDNEIAAVKAAVAKYGQALVDLIIGMSIGSEDLYRNSNTGMVNKAGIGNQPAAIVGFINDFRSAFANTSLAAVPIGHVDTWDAWTNGTNKPVIDAVDWLGVDEYPYYQNGTGNTIEHAPALFDTAYDAVVAVATGKSVWVTETGWPVSGPTWDQAVASLANAQYYWDHVGCRRLFDKVPTFWYILQESNPPDKPTFAITANSSTSPLFNLTCPAAAELSSSSSSSSTLSPTPSPSSLQASQYPSVPTGTSRPPSSATTTTGTASAASPSSTSNLAPQHNHVGPAALYACLALTAGFFCSL